MKSLIKLIASCFFGPYSIYCIYKFQDQQLPHFPIGNLILSPIQDIDELTQSPDPSIQALVEYGGDNSFGFGAWIDGKLASVCWIWTGERYNTSRNFWPLRDGEVKLVQVSTAERFRGRGIAPRLINYATHQMKQIGYHCLYARIWHSNQSSITAFQKSGWIYIALVIEIFPLGSKNACRIVRKKASF